MSAGVFEGLSTLRKKEDSKPKLPSEQATRLQQYFAERYGPINNNQRVDEKKKTKKKKSKKIKAEEKDSLVAKAEGRVRIVDEDITGFRDAYPKVNGSTYDEDDEDEGTCLFCAGGIVRMFFFLISVPDKVFRH
jgi:hypothetical protein